VLVEVLNVLLLLLQSLLDGEEPVPCQLDSLFVFAVSPMRLGL